MTIKKLEPRVRAWRGACQFSCLSGVEMQSTSTIATIHHSSAATSRSPQVPYNSSQKPHYIRPAAEPEQERRPAISRALPSRLFCIGTGAHNKRGNPWTAHHVKRKINLTALDDSAAHWPNWIGCSPHVFSRPVVCLLFVWFSTSGACHSCQHYPLRYFFVAGRRL